MLPIQICCLAIDSLDQCFPEVLGTVGRAQLLGRAPLGRYPFNSTRAGYVKPLPRDKKDTKRLLFALSIFLIMVYTKIVY